MTLQETFQEMEEITDGLFSIRYEVRRPKLDLGLEIKRVCEIYMGDGGLLEEASTFQLALDQIKERKGLITPDTLDREGAE